MSQQVYCCTGFLQTASYQEVPLKSQNVYLSTKNQVADFVIKQVYTNEEKTPIEALLKFPTPDGASVYSCEAKNDEGTVIQLQVKEKTKAKEEYNKAISQGDTAYYVQQESGDILKMAVGNLAPNSSVEITIKYVLLLNNEEDHKKLRIMFPLTILPRYSPVYDAPAGRSMNPTYTKSKPFEMSIEGDICATDGIISLDSKTHKIKLSDMKENSLHFAIQDLNEINKDIILTLERKDSKSNAFTQEFKGDLQNKSLKHCTSVNIVPDWSKYPAVNVNNVHYVIVLDKSGSMSGSSMDLCKDATQQFVGLLPVGCTFDVYTFNDSFEKFKGNSNGDFTDANAKKQAVSKWIDSISATGGTEILPVLKNIYDELKSLNKLGVIIFLSDGGVSNTEEILKTVRENQGASIFSIGIGDNVSQSLILGLASQSSGHAEFIGSGDKNIIHKVRAQLKKSQDSLRKHQDEYSVEIMTIGGSFRTVPEKLPTLYDRTNNVMHVFSEYLPASVKYTEKSSGESIVLVPEDITETSDYSLHRIAGVKLIEDLQHKQSNQRKSKVDDLKADTDPHKDEIISISTDLNILSKYTAFVGVDVRKNKILDEMQLREVPLQSNWDRSPSFASRGVMPMYSMSPMMMCSGSPPPTRSFAAKNFTARRFCDSSVQKESLCMQSSRCNRNISHFGITTASVTPDSDNEYDEMDTTDDRELTNQCGVMMDECDNKSSSSKPSTSKQLTPKYTVKVSLKGMYISLSRGSVLTANANGSLSDLIRKLTNGSDSVTFNIGDIVKLTSESDPSLNVHFEIISVGSVDEPWTLSKVQ